MHRLGPYTLLTRIGVGGMAEIFLARRKNDGAVVALKRILPHLVSHEDFVNMFLDEARLAARLDHPNIARVLDLGKDGDVFYMALEYVPGEDLLTVIRRAREKRLLTPLIEACAILADAASALHHAHERRDEQGRALGIVHRDVTPSNLILSHDGQVKLVDFGIAKAERRAAVTQAGALKGKYAYMAPEYALGETIDRRADVFSLGVVAFELLTERRLFHRDSELAVLRALTEERIPTPSEKRSDLPSEIDAVIMRALARDPADRWSSAADFEQALRGFLARGSRAPNVAGWMDRLFGPAVAEQRRKWAIGDLDEGDATSVTEFQTPAPTKPRSRVPDDDLDHQGTGLMNRPTPSREAGGRPPTPRPVVASGSPPRPRLSPPLAAPPQPPPSPVPIPVASPADRTQPLELPLAAPRLVDIDEAAEAETRIATSSRRPAQSFAPPAAPIVAQPVFPREDARGIETEAVVKLSPEDDGKKVWIVVGVILAAGLGFYLALRGGGDVAVPLTPAGSALVDPSDQPLPAPELSERAQKQLATPVARPGQEGETAIFGVDGPAGATLIIDGETAGTLPLPTRRLPAGLHTITISLPGGEPQSFAVDLAPGDKHIELVEANGDSGTLRHERQGQGKKRRDE